MLTTPPAAACRVDAIVGCSPPTPAPVDDDDDDDDDEPPTTDPTEGSTIEADRPAPS
jgi:hypothetical protein